MASPPRSSASGRVGNDARRGTHRCGWLFIVLLSGFLVNAASAFEVQSNFLGTTLELQTGIPDAQPNFPPDIAVAVGSTHIVEMLNGSFTVYDKSTQEVVGSRITLDAFWENAFATSGSPEEIDVPSFSPRVVYDPSVQRWFAVAADGGRLSDNDGLFIAVSLGPDPAGDWAGFSFEMGPETHYFEVPAIGVNRDGVYVSANIGDNQGNNGPEPARLIGIPKSSLTASVPSISGVQDLTIVPFGPGLGELPTLQPVVDLDNDGGGLPILWADHDAPNAIRRSTVTSVLGPDPMAIDPASQDIAIATDPAPRPPMASQPNGADQFYIGEGQFLSAVVKRGGKLWAVAVTDVGGRAAIRWYRIDEGTNTVEESGTIADAARDFWLFRALCG